jgi:hypothetical protein
MGAHDDRRLTPPIMDTPRSRRTAIGDVAKIAASLALSSPLAAFAHMTSDDAHARRDLARNVADDPELARLTAWTTAVRSEHLTAFETPVGRTAARVGELAVGTPYVANTLEEYLKAGSVKNPEPLTLSLTRFDCVTLVESCLAVSRVARAEAAPTWDAFGREVERMRYRNGTRGDYTTRLHYFSEWISDGQHRGSVLNIGAALGGVEDERPLRFMTEHRASYAALAGDRVFAAIAAMERGLDGHSRRVIPTAKIAEVSDGIHTGDVLAFATSIPGLDVTHAAFAYRDASNVLRVLHAPLSGGAVEVSTRTLPEYVAAIKRSTGVMVARPL